MGPDLRVCVLAAVADPVAARLGRLLDAPTVSSARALLGRRHEVVIVRGRLERAMLPALVATIAGVAAVIYVPVGPAAPLPWWGRRFHRLLFASQADARAWSDVGVALGRMVVVEPSDDEEERRALAALILEVSSMASRPAAR